MGYFSSSQKGFSLVELLIVVSLIALISGFLVIGFQNFASYQQYKQAVGDVEFSLNQSKVKARSAVSDSKHGIKFANDRITKFVGSTYSVSSPTNEVIIYSLVTLQANLTGGVDEIIFNKLSGLPSATGTIVISGTIFSASTTIEVTDSGVIQY